METDKTVLSVKYVSVREVVVHLPGSRGQSHIRVSSLVYQKSTTEEEAAPVSSGGLSGKNTLNVTFLNSKNLMFV